MLEFAGLEAREERAYRELVRLPAASAGDLATLLTVDIDEIGVVLAGLEAKGLVSQVPGPDRQFRATAPERAFGPALRQHQERLSAVGRLADEYRSRTALRGAGELVEIIYGSPAIGQQIEQLQRAARAEVRWLVKPPTVAEFAEHNAAQLDAMSTGVRNRAIYELSLLELPGDPHGIAAGAASGEEARVLPELPVAMVVADRELAIVPVAPTETPDELSAIVVHASGLLNALIALFEQLWDSASPLLFTADGGMQANGDPDGPSAADLHLLSLIVAGLTDHAIAAQLGMSTRTVQRRIRVLLELTGVQTRLQLVWQAARRGWL